MSQQRVLVSSTGLYRVRAVFTNEYQSHWTYSVTPGGGDVAQGFIEVFSALEGQTSFPLSQPASDSFHYVVSINGMVQHPDSYYFESGSLVLRYPSALDDIVCVFPVAGLQKTESDSGGDHDHSELEQDIADLQQQISELQSGNQRQDADIAQLTADIAELDARVGELESAGPCPGGGNDIPANIETVYEFYADGRVKAEHITGDYTQDTVFYYDELDSNKILSVVTVRGKYQITETYEYSDDGMVIGSRQSVMELTDVGGAS